jgi:hypothetical protein
MTVAQHSSESLTLHDWVVKFASVGNGLQQPVSKSLMISFAVVMGHVSTIIFITRGRPGPRRWLQFHLDAISSRYQRNSVSGVTRVSSPFNTLRPSA